MKTILFIFPRGEAIKNFVYSGITDELRKGHKIIFYSVIPNETIKSYLINKCDFFLELPDTSTSNRYSKELKEVLKIAHVKNVNSVTGNLKIVKDDLESKKRLKSNLIRRARKFMASFYNSKEGLIKLTAKYVRSNFKNKEVLEYEKELLKINPDIVFNTSHVHNSLSLNLMFAVKKLELKTATFLFSWDNLTSQGRIIPEYDYYFTWNNKIKNDLLDFYPHLSSKSIFVTGTPQFDFHFNQDFIFTKDELYSYLGIPSHKNIVLYSTGMSYYVPKEHKIVLELEKILKQIDKDLQLVVRIYAKDDNEPYYQIRKDNKNIVIPDHFWELNHLTPTLKDVKLFNSLLNHCFLGINVASTVSLDLAILNKPIINVAFNPPNENIYPNDYKKIYDFDHYKPIIETGAISLANSTLELKQMIENYLQNPNDKEKEREKLVSSFFGNELTIDKAKEYCLIFDKIT